jgi:hypothetical protein
MGKVSGLEKAIQNLSEQIGVLQLAREHLVQQRDARPKVAKKPKLRGLPESAVQELVGKIAR